MLTINYLTVKRNFRLIVLDMTHSLTLKVPITSAAENINTVNTFFHCFSEKIRLDVSSESFARQRIHLKHQALFSSKDKSKKLKCHLLQFLFGTLRVKLELNLNFFSG